MKFLYVGKHDQPCSNDDEGAIHYALEGLGHGVQRVRESIGHKAYRVLGDSEVLLFHKWQGAAPYLRYFEGRLLRAFWYFDLVEYLDPALARRNAERRSWMLQTLPHVELGFCTDGDWVSQVNDDLGQEKLVVLRQGADGRVAGKGTPRQLPGGQRIPILLTGSGSGGQGRRSFVDELSKCYRERFVHVEKGVHGRALADLIATSDIVVAPDHPTTDRYWSNRVYLMLGFGAFLLHPYCSQLALEYEDGVDLVFYHDRTDLHDKLAHYLHQDQAEERRRVSENGLQTTLANYTYTHRCTALVEELQRRLKTSRGAD